MQHSPPEVLWTGHPVSVEHFQIPLSKCWAYRDKELRADTLDHQRFEGVFVGYSTNSPCYKVLDQTSGTVYHRRYADVKFASSSAPADTKPQSALVDAVLRQMDDDALAAMERQEKEIELAAKQEVLDGYIRISKNSTVKALAQHFCVEPQSYLAELQALPG